MSALKEDGFKIGNYNFGHQNKFGNVESAIGNGARSSSWNKYLKHALYRKNLNVIPFAKVQKINFDTNQRAISVSYKHQGMIKVSKVSKEVIVSASAIESPHLLMVSGVGDYDHLKRFNIDPLVSNLPSVGKHLQDHLVTVIGFLSLGKVKIEAPSIFDSFNYVMYKKGSWV